MFATRAPTLRAFDAVRIPAYSIVVGRSHGIRRTSISLLTLPHASVSYSVAVSAAQSNITSSKQKRAKIIKARIAQPDKAPVTKKDTSIDIKKLSSIPKHVMAPFLSGHYAADSVNRHSIHHAIMTQDLARLKLLIEGLHDHVNAVAQKLQADNFLPDIEHRDVLFAADSTPSSPSLACRYLLSLRDSDGLCPLLQCFPQNLLAEARALVEAGADVNGVYDVGVPLSPVMIACNMSLTDMALMLLDHGADAEIVLGDKCLLYLAVITKNATIVQRLLARGVSPAPADAAQGYPLVNAAVYMGNRDMVKAFLDYYCGQVDPTYVSVDFSKGEGVCDILLREEVKGEEEIKQDELLREATAALKEMELEEKNKGVAVDAEGAEADEEGELVEKLIQVQKSPLIPDLSNVCDLNGMLMIAIDRGDHDMGVMLARYGAMLEFAEEDIELETAKHGEK